MFSNCTITEKAVYAGCKGYSVQIFSFSSNRFACIIEDSLVLLFDYGHSFCQDNVHNSIMILELTPNLIEVRFDIPAFKESLCSAGVLSVEEYIHYSKYKDSTYYWWVEPSFDNWIEAQMPELRVRERIDAWPGIPYNFVVIEVDNSNGTKAYAVAYTQQKPHRYVVSVCEKWIKSGQFHSNAINDGIVERKINAAFASWKGERRQKRLEEHLRYHTVEKMVKDLGDIYGVQRSTLEAAQSGQYDSIEKSTYLRPINKWISEENVYNLTKKLYKEYHVIYQYRPFFPRSTKGGQMAYDVYIAGLRTAIEYQGKQHFEPVDFFGGELGFRQVQVRDAEKKALSEKNGINLVSKLQ